MDRIKNIDKNQFRGINHLKVEDFARVNLFVGQYNSVKSKLLKALAVTPIQYFII